MSKRVVPLLLIVNVVLAVGLALLWIGPGRSTTWPPPAAQPPNLDDARAAMLKSHPGAAAEYPQIAERPVFFVSRRPIPVESVAKDAAAPPPPPPVALDKLRMFGTINGPTMRGVLAEVEGKSQFVRSGDKVGDWTLRGISNNEATFEKGDEKRVIILPLAGGGAPKVAQPQAPAAKAPAPSAAVPAQRPATRAESSVPKAASTPPAAPVGVPAPPKPKASGPIGSWGP